MEDIIESIIGQEIEPDDMAVDMREFAKKHKHKAT